MCRPSASPLDPRLPEVVVGRVRDLCGRPDRTLVALGGGGGKAARGRHALDEGRAREAAACRAGRGRGSLELEPRDREWVDGDPVDTASDDVAPILRLPRRPAEVGDDDLAAVVVQICPRCDQVPFVAAADNVARVDLDADGVPDEEHLVRVVDLDLVRHRRRRRSCACELSERPGRRGSDDPRKDQAAKMDLALHVEYLQSTVSGWARRYGRTVAGEIPETRSLFVATRRYLGSASRRASCVRERMPSFA